MKNTENRKVKKGDAGPNIFNLLKPYSLMVSMLIMMALASNGLNLFIPKIIATNIDDYAAGRFDIQRLLVMFTGTSLLIFLFSYLQSLLQVFLSEKVGKELRSKLSDKISRQSYAYILKTNPSKLLTNLTSDIDSIKMFVSQAVVTIISSAFVIVATCILLFSINWMLALAVISIVPIIGFAFFLIMKRVRPMFKKGRENIDKLNKVINESIWGSAIIRVINSQQSESHKFLTINLEAREIGMSILYQFATLMPFIMFVANLASVIILAMGGHFVVAGKMTLGSFAAFNSYLAMLIFPIIMIGFMSNLIASATASYRRIQEVLTTKETVEAGTISGEISGNVSLKNVTLYYGEKPVLKDITFDIKAGSRTAIIGPTAAGKSQLLYLLTNLMHQNSGQILLDGVDLEEYSKEIFHSQIGFVFQDSVIFNMSIRENIAFSDKVSDQAMQKAIETAQLADFIEALPQKMDTVVSERGTSLSGGEKQRMMLARALALHPKILLLDDFTSRVDRNTENKILQSLAENYPGITLISVSQKIAPIRQFDQIVLLMEGEVIAVGTHQELKVSSPEYVQIYESQKSTQHYETSM